MTRAGKKAGAETRAVAWRSFAEANLFTGRLNEARHAYESATRHARKAGRKALIGQILVGRIGTLNLMGETTGTAALAAKAKTLLDAAGDTEYLAKLYMNLGSAHYHAERFGRAHEDYERASEYFVAAGSVDATWVGLRLNQGVACTHLLRLAEARDLFLETESTARRLGLHRLQAQALFNLADVDVLSGDFRSALRLLGQAESIFERHGVRDMQAASLLALADIHITLAMPSESLDLARAAAEFFETEGMALDAMLSRLTVARSLTATRRPGKALPVLEDALAYYDRRRIRPRKAEVLLELSRARRLLREYPESLRLARRALRVFESLSLPGGVARARCVVAEVQLDRGRPREAEDALSPSLEAEGSLQLGTRFAVWLLGGRIARSLGRRHEAVRRLRHAIVCLEDQRRLVPGLEMRSRFFEHQVAAYNELISIRVESEPTSVSNVLQLVEAARGRGFRERLRGVGVTTTREITRRRALLGSLTRKLETMEMQGESGSQEGTRLRRKVLSLEKDVARRARRIEALAAEARDDAGAAKPEDIVKAIRRDEAVIEYFVTDRAVLAVVLHRDGSWTRTLSEDGVREAVDSLRLQLEFMAATAAGPLGDEKYHLESTKRDLEALYRRLLHPIGDLLAGKRRLTIIPHRFLHLVPFECLFDGERYIDETFFIGRSPTADFLLRRERARSRARRVLVAGMEDGGPAHIARELDSVADAFDRGQKVQVLRNPGPAEVLRELPRARFAHLAAHGIFREDNPVFSRLSLRDGALFLADVLETRLRADLVVLSACDSGQVLTDQGDTLSGVAHGFLAAGARRLVAALWRVHDRATASWIDSFYRSLTGESRGDPVRALNAAARATRATWPHPFYWGGFCVHGS